jgi:hypothetical protein
MDMVRTWSTIGAAYRTAMAMPQGKLSQHAESYGGEWKAILTSLEAGKRVLPDAPRNVKVRSSARSSGEPRPTFTRENALNDR